MHPVVSVAILSFETHFFDEVFSFAQVSVISKISGSFPYANASFPVLMLLLLLVLFGCVMLNHFPISSFPW